jgi:hypothetical protein
MMMPSSFFARAAGLALSAVVGAATLVLPTLEQTVLQRAKHGPIEVGRNPDATPARGLRNELRSSNWAGYEVANYQTGQKYTSAQMTWKVPSVNYGSSTDSTSSNEYSANWVGIGGFCENRLCTRGDRTLIQLGTEQDVSPSGATQYSAWYEMLSKAEIPIETLPVNPGDQITASLSCGTTCSNRTQTWLLTMTNNTTGAQWSGSFKYASSLLSTEWIEEAPYSGGVLPLADFDISSFGPNTANGAYPSLSVSQNGIQMVDPWDQTANPSNAYSSADFYVCWGYQTPTSCQ